MRQKLRRQNAAICWLINMNKKNSNQISWLDFQLCDPISEWRLLLYFCEYVYVTESCFSSLTIICEFNRTYYTWFFFVLHSKFGKQRMKIGVWDEAWLGLSRVLLKINA